MKSLSICFSAFQYNTTVKQNTGNAYEAVVSVPFNITLL